MTLNDYVDQRISRRANRSSGRFVCIPTVLILLGTIVIHSPVVSQSNRSGANPVELLRGMSDSIETLTYEGTFVYVLGGQVETMKILHINNGGTTNEYLTSLNGEAREIFRNNSLVTCIWPASQSMISLKSKKRNLSNNFNFALRGSDNYQFFASPDDRVAGRNTYVVNVKSNDHYRYSYKIWIDKRTKMLLRSISLDGSSRPVEQVMFTNIRFSDDITIEDVDTKIAHLNYTNETYADATDMSTTTASPIRFEGLPVGYTRVAEMVQPKIADNSPIRHILLSDGMASVSVYVQFKYPPTVSNSVGLSTLGGIAAFSRDLGSAYTTVIGAVPVETARAIAQAVKIDTAIPVR